MFKMHVTSVFAAFYIRELIVLANVAKIKRSRIKDGLQYTVGSLLLNYIAQYSM